LSDELYDEDGNEIVQDGTDGSPKALRDAYNKQKAQNAALEKTIEELSGKVRTREIADALSEKKIDKRVARFIPADAVLDDWLKENGELFGVAVTEGEQVEQATETATTQVEPHPLQGQFADLAGATEGATAPTGTVDVAKAQEALATGGLEGYEAYLRSHAVKR
jgi:hypothetical protein